MRPFAAGVLGLLGLGGCDADAPGEAPEAPGPRCGDAVLDLGELCDDGNASYADGCTPDCVLTDGSEGVDEVLLDFMARWEVPSLSFAVARDGRLAVLRAYGVADATSGRAAHGDDRYRIASLSKPITAAVVLRLVEQGLIDLDDSVAEHVGALDLPEPADPRLRDVTVRDLLQHSGGWDRDVSGDPMFASAQISAALGEAGPASAADVIRYQWGQPLDFAPGSTFAYSNFGYALAGRIIEGATGEPYADAARRLLLAPAGAPGVALGASLVEGRGPREVRYVDHAGAGTTPSVFPGGGDVPWPDGGFHLEAMDAHGGWVASAPELARIVLALDGAADPPDVVSPASIAAMTARPALDLWENAVIWYGLGWNVRETPGGQNWWHSGSLPGSGAIVVRRDDGVVWVLLTNTRPADAAGYSLALDQVGWEAVRQIKAWPPFDLFDVPGR